MAHRYVGRPGSRPTERGNTVGYDRYERVALSDIDLAVMRLARAEEWIQQVIDHLRRYDTEADERARRLAECAYLKVANTHVDLLRYHPARAD